MNLTNQSTLIKEIEHIVSKSERATVDSGAKTSARPPSACHRVSHRKQLKRNDMPSTSSLGSGCRSFSEKANILRNQSKHIEAFANLHTMFRLFELKKEKMAVKHVFEYLRVYQKQKWRPILSPATRQVKAHNMRMKQDFIKSAYASTQPNDLSGKINVYQSLNSEAKQKYPSTQGGSIGQLASSGFINTSSHNSGANPNHSHEV